MDELNQIKSKKRVKELGEVFTPLQLVNEMLDKLPAEVWGEHKTFLEPAVGTGNFLIPLLERKLSLGHDPLIALSTIYAVDIMTDNIIECKQRILAVVWDILDDDGQREAICIVNSNIRVGNTLEVLSE
jgi:hypothetical protein